MASRWADRARDVLARLSPFERQVVAAAADRILRDLESPEKRRQAAQERRRRALIDQGHSPQEAAALAREGRTKTPWVRQGGDGRDLSVSRRERARMRRWTGYGA